MIMRKRIVIVGAGGFAREVAWLIADLNRVRDEWDFRGFVVSDVTRLSDRDSLDLVLGDFDWLSTHRGEVDALAFGIGTPGPKAALSRTLAELVPEVDWPALVHPTAQFERQSASVGRGVVLCAGVIGTVNLVLDDFVMVNLACTLGHEARLGRCAALNPTVNVSGGVNIGEEVLVGTGAQILQYVNIGANAVVGAGACVTKDVPPGVTVVGVPAKQLQRGT